MSPLQHRESKHQAKVTCNTTRCPRYGTNGTIPSFFLHCMVSNFSPSPRSIHFLPHPRFPAPPCFSFLFFFAYKARRTGQGRAGQAGAFLVARSWFLCLPPSLHPEDPGTRHPVSEPRHFGLGLGTLTSEFGHRFAFIDSLLSPET